MVSRRAYLGCSQLLHRHIGRYRRSKHRKLLTASNTTRHLVVRLFPVGNGAMFMQHCRRKLGLTVRTMVTCQSGVSITNFKDVPCYELRPRGVMVRVLARDTKGSRVRLPAVSLSANSALGKLFTHTCASVTKQYNLLPGSRGGDALRLGR